MTVTPLPPRSVDTQIRDRLRSVDYQNWRAAVTATGGCLQPVHMTGSWEVRTPLGEVLASRSGRTLAPCGNRREAVCPACSDRYAADAYHLLRAGLSGGSKGVPTSVRDRPRLFVTLTAPSFGPVHSRRISRRGRVIPCQCGSKHHPDDSRIGTAVDPDTYDYVGAVLWQATLGALWNRTTIRLRRVLANAAGITIREFGDHARISYARVAEYQRRGLIHLHVVVRLDGPEGPDSPPPSWAHPDVLADAITQAASDVEIPLPDIDGITRTAVWGAQVDIRPITATKTEGDDGELSEERVASYVAKYATKSTGATDTPDRRIRSQNDINQLRTTPHHKRMIQTAWDLGAHPEAQGLNLRRWAHMLGFRGHFLSKSTRYSVTFKQLRGDRSEWRHQQALDHLGVTADSVVVVNDWQFATTGHATQGDRELAEAIANRARQQRQRKHHGEELAA